MCRYYNTCISRCDGPYYPGWRYGYGSGYGPLYGPRYWLDRYGYGPGYGYLGRYGYDDWYY